MEPIECQYREMLQRRLRSSEKFLDDFRAMAERLDCLLESGFEDRSGLCIEIRASLVVDCEELAAEAKRLKRQLVLMPSSYISQPGKPTGTSAPKSTA
jgi:hypothetical protein